MRQPPSLIKQPSDFEKKKRQPFLFEAYYLNFIDGFYRDTLPNLHQWNIQVSKGDSASMADSYRLLASDLFELWSLKFTAGEPPDKLREEFAQVVDFYEKKAQQERIVESDPVYPAFDLPYLDDYVRYVALLSIAVLLHREDLIPRIHALIAGSEFDKDEALVEELLTRYLPDRPYLDTFYHDEPYEPLLDATAGDTPDEKLADLKTYLKKWYGGMKGTGWYNAHKGMTDEGGGYFGYWAWEAGAIAYLHNIDDSTIDSVYYPKDLVAFARSVPAPPSSTPQESQQAKRLRCEAGQPCPKSGSWSSPAHPQGNRHFQQGEVMPHIEGNSWGATIWYYAGE